MAELIALFTTAKALGFDMAIISSMMVIALMLLIFSTVVIWKLVTPFKSMMSELTLSVKSLTDTLSEHVKKVDARMTNGDNRFLSIEKEIEAIKKFINKGDQNV